MSWLGQGLCPRTPQKEKEPPMRSPEELRAQLAAAKTEQEREKTISETINEILEQIKENNKNLEEIGKAFIRIAKNTP